MPAEGTAKSVGKRAKIHVALALILVVVVGFTGYKGLVLVHQHQAESVVIPPDGMVPGAGQMPGWLQVADPSIQKEFVWAALHKAELQYVPCYCGCMAQGHTSNADCFFDFDAAGNVTGYDSHAFGCGVCLDISRAVRQGLARGKPLTQIRQEIDAKYQAQGMPSTPTPAPPAS